MTQTPDLPACLQDLTGDQRWLVNDQLSNNESSDDEELITYLMDQGALTREQAEAAVSYRDEALRDSSFELFDGPYEPRQKP